MTKAAIVTGANGFIGSHLVGRLLRDGWAIHGLGRGKEHNWEERVIRAVREANTGISELNNLHCHEWDLCRPELPFPARSLRNAGKMVLVHLAADTRFIPLNPDAQRSINVDGALNAIRTLHPLVAKVVHVSTAYVAGDRTGLVLESETDAGQQFHNNYERTKLEAEVRIRKLCNELGLPLTIARPAIVVNDTLNGRSPTFTHLNVLVEAANRIQEFYGIHDGEVVNRSIRVPMNSTSRPNMAPVDAVAELLAVIVASPASIGKTFHLCHPSPQSNDEVFGLILEAFDIKTKINLDFVTQMTKPLTRTENLLARALKVYQPYLNQSARFDVSNMRALVPAFDALFQPLKVDYLKKVIAFAREERKKKSRQRMI